MFAHADGIDMTFEVKPAEDNKPGYDVTIYYADLVNAKMVFATRKHIDRPGEVTLLQPDLHAKLKYHKGKPWSQTMAMVPDDVVNKALSEMLASVMAEVRKQREGAIAAGGGTVQSASAPTL